MEQENGQKEKSNSKIWWLLGCGCGGILLAVGAVVAFLVFGIGGIGGLGAALKSNAPYTDSVTAVQSNAAAIEALGEPIEPGWMPSGNISVENNTGKVDFSIGVSGPKGTGTIKVIGTKANGVWTYQTWHLKVDGQEKVIPLGK